MMVSNTEGRHFKGFFIFDDELVPFEFVDLKFDPQFGVVEGESVCGSSVSGVVNKRGKFSFKLMDSSCNERYCWGRMSKDRKKIEGCWGWEQEETEDQFKMSLVEDDDEYYDEETNEHNPDDYAQSEEYASEEVEPEEAKTQHVIVKQPTRKIGRPKGVKAVQQQLGDQYKKLNTFSKQAKGENIMLDGAL
jgi:hypothetical protein